MMQRSSPDVSAWNMSDCAEAKTGSQCGTAFRFSSEIPEQGSEGSRALERLSRARAPHSERLYLLAAALTRYTGEKWNRCSSEQHTPQAGKTGRLSDRKTSHSVALR